MQRKTIDALPSRSKEKAFGGRWRIEELELWDQEVADEFGPAHITFEKNGLGHFHFCCVDAELDWRFDRQRNRTEFTFEGQDEMDEVSGRGWARIEGPDNQMVGEIAFHRGDESGFKAKRSQS